MTHEPKGQVRGRAGRGGEEGGGRGEGGGGGGWDGRGKEREEERGIKWRREGKGSINWKGHMRVSWPTNRGMANRGVYSKNRVWLPPTNKGMAINQYGCGYL